MLHPRLPGPMYNSQRLFLRDRFVLRLFEIHYPSLRLLSKGGTLCKNFTHFGGHGLILFFQWVLVVSFTIISSFAKKLYAYSTVIYNIEVYVNHCYHIVDTN